MVSLSILDNIVFFIEAKIVSYSNILSNKRETMKNSLCNTVYKSTLISIIILLSACNSSGSNSSYTSNTLTTSSNLNSTTTEVSMAPLKTVVLSNPNRRLAHVGVNSILQIQSQLPLAQVLISPPNVTGNFSKTGDNTYTFTPNTSFSFDTSYTVVLIDGNGNVLPDTYYFDTQPQYKIFDSAPNFENQYTGNGTTGIAGFDKICNAAASSRGYTAPYKAMLGSWGGTAGGIVRTICANDSTSSLSSLENGGACGNSFSVNWVMQPNSTYYNTNGKLIQNSDSYAVLPVDATNWYNTIYTSGGNKHAFTGFNANWSVLTGTNPRLTSGDLTCNGWTSSNSSSSTFVGLHERTDYKVLNGGGTYTKCNTTAQVACIEQAPIALIQPANTSSASLITPIEIQFPYQVNKDSVGESTIRVIDNNTKKLIEASITESTNVDGTTSAPNNTNFILTPKQPLLNGHSYTVYINSDESGKQLSMIDGVGILVPSKIFTFSVFRNASIPTMLTPAAGQRTNVPENTSIVLQLSPDTDPNTLNENTIIVTENISDTPKTQSKQVQQVLTTNVLFHMIIAYGAYTLVTLTPDKALDDYAKVNVNLKNVKNKNGTPVPNYKWNFFTPSPVNEASIIAPQDLNNVSVADLVFVLKFPQIVDPNLTGKNAVVLTEKSTGYVVNTTTKVGIKGDNYTIATKALETLKTDTDYSITGTVYYTNGTSGSIVQQLHTAKTQDKIMINGSYVLKNIPTNNVVIDINWGQKVTGNSSSIIITELGTNKQYSSSTSFFGRWSRTKTAGLNPNTTYTISDNGQIKNDQGLLVGIESTTVVTRDSNDMRIFVNKNNNQGFTGRLAITVRNIVGDEIPYTGKYAADYYCNHDAAHQSYYNEGRRFKAVLSYYNPYEYDVDTQYRTQRYACLHYNNAEGTDYIGCGGPYAMDWGLQPSVSYLNDVGSLVGYTNSNGLFPYNLYATIDLANADSAVWTGTLADWTPQLVDGGPDGSLGTEASCAGWTSETPISPNTGYLPTYIGNGRSTITTQVLNNGVAQCSTRNYIYCAQE